MLCPIPFNEPYRQRKLRDYGIETIPQQAFVHIADLARMWFETPVATISFIEDEKQIFKGQIGLRVASTARAHSFCAHAILSDDVMVVEDAQDDRRFQNNPLVTGEPHIRFYAGAPLITSDGFRLGTVCVISQQPRYGIDDRDRRYLSGLARLAVQHLDDIRNAALKSVGRVDRDDLIGGGEQAAGQQAKKDFLAMVSHELRTPLNAVIGFTELLLAEAFGPHPSPKYREYIEDIQLSGEHIRSLIDGILKFTEIETGDITLEENTTSPDAVIRRVLALCRPAAETRSIKVDVSCRTPMNLNIDAKLIAHAVTNILLNAIEVSEPGATVSLRFGAGETGCATFSIEDQGNGLPREIWERLGEPFVRGGDPHLARSSGLGLGLPIACRLVWLHGGSLRVSPPDSHPHRIDVILPRDRSEVVSA